MSIAYQCYANGEYLGPIEDGGLLPNNATYDKPPASKKGYARFYKNGKWRFVEDHRGESGWINGVETVIREAGPYPNSWSATAPEPTDAEKKEAECQRILTELDRLDAKSCRPARAVSIAYAAGKTPDEADVVKLAEIEEQAKALRLELAKLNG